MGADRGRYYPDTYPTPEKKTGYVSNPREKTRIRIQPRENKPVNVSNPKKKTGYVSNPREKKPDTYPTPEKKTRICIQPSRSDQIPETKPDPDLTVDSFF